MKIEKVKIRKKTLLHKRNLFPKARTDSQRRIETPILNEELTSSTEDYRSENRLESKPLWISASLDDGAGYRVWLERRSD